MSAGGRNCFISTAFIIVVIVVSVFSLDIIFSADNRPSIVNSFHKLVNNNDYCRSRNGTFSIGDAKTCNCTLCVSQSSCAPSSSNITAPQVIVKEKVIEKPCKNESPWYAENTVWHYPALFPRCSMDVCFNYSRCENMDVIKIFVYDLPPRHSRYFQWLNSTKWFTKDPNKACLFFVYMDLLDPYHNPPPAPPSTLPFWNGGMNHVLVSFHDMWKLTGLPMENTGMASLLITDMHETIYRPGFDISITLPPHMRLTHLQQIKSFDRKYFLTFRGLRYLGHEGEWLLRSHNSFRNMHNGKDIIVAVSCRHPVNDEWRKKEPKLGVNCTEDEAIYDRQDYVDLMNSTFGLAPAGIQPISYRFLEILSAGTIPVLIADNYVKPIDNLIQWYRCILQFPTKEMHRIVPILRRMSKDEAEQRQKYCLEVYEEFLKDDVTLCKSAVRSLRARMMGFFSNFEQTGEN